MFRVALFLGLLIAMGIGAWVVIRIVNGVAASLRRRSNNKWKS